MSTWIPLLVALAFPQGQPPQATGPEQHTDASFLNRWDLPDEFDFPLLELNFAVLRVRLVNDTGKDWPVSEAALEARDPKGRKLKRAAPEEITPKIMESKILKPSSRRIAGDVGGGVGYPRRYPGGYPGAYPGPVVVSPGGGPKKVAVGRAQEIRSALERHELSDVVLRPGESLEALVYFKSKKKVTELSGGQLKLGDILIEIQ